MTSIDQLIRRARTWRLFYSVTHFAARLALLTALGAALLWGAELLQPAPPTVRRLLWSLGLLLSAAAAARAAIGGLSARDLAQQLGQALRPADLLLNLRELSGAGSADPFIARDLSSFERQRSQASPSRLTRPETWNRDLARAGIAAIALLILAFFPHAGLRFAARRALWPWAAEEAWLRLRPGTARVPSGESVVIEALPLDRRGAPTLYVRGEGGWEPRPFVQDGEGRYRAVLERVTDPLRYRARHRGLWSATHRLTPYLPLRFERLSFHARPPAHTGLPAERIEGALALRVPAGTVLEGEGRLDRPAAAASLSGPAGTVPLAGAPGRDISFRLTPKRDGLWRFAFKSEEGDETEIPLQIEAVPDEAPRADILSPEGEAAVSPRERLPVVYELSDDYGLTAARLRLRLSDGSERTVSLTAENGLGDVMVVPARLGLKDGDTAELWIEAEDRNPAGPGRAKSALVTLRVTDAAARAEKALEELDRWSDSLLAAKADEDSLAAKLSAESPSFPDIAARQRMAEQGIRELSDQLDRISQELARDRDADPWLALEHRAIHEAMKDLQRSELPKASAALAKADKAAAQASLEKVSRELGRLAAASKEAHKTAEARALADRDAVEDAAQELADLLDRPLTDASKGEVNALMQEIAEELRKVAEMAARMPEFLPPPGAGENPGAVLKMEDMLKNLADAARAAQAGDAKAAAEAARKLLEQVRAMREILSRAGEQFSGEGGLSPQASKEWAEAREKLQDLITRQETLKASAAKIWDDAYLRLREEQEKVLASSPTAVVSTSPALTAQDRAGLASQAQEQDALQRDTQALKEAMVRLGQRTARLGPDQLRRMEDASTAMTGAAAALRQSAPTTALAAQEEALRLLREGESQMNSSMSSPMSSGSSPMPSPGGSGGEGGLPMLPRPIGPTRLPRVQDYRPPKEFREDILRALEENYPARDKPVIEEYFKRWKK